MIVVKKVTKMAQTFRMDPVNVDRLEKLAKMDRRSKTATLEILIEEAWKARFPEKKK